MERISKKLKCAMLRRESVVGDGLEKRVLPADALMLYILLILRCNFHEWKDKQLDDMEKSAHNLSLYRNFRTLQKHMLTYSVNECCVELSLEYKVVFFPIFSVACLFSVLFAIV